MLAEKHFPPDAFDVEEHRYIHPFALPFGEESQGEERQKRYRALWFLCSHKLLLN